MTLDARARGAAKGIHRAVTVMEAAMQGLGQIERFDHFRARKARNRRIAAVVVGIAVPVAVIVGGMPQARITDKAICVGPIDVIVKGSATVLVGGLPAARIGDMTAHGGVIVTGFPTALIGG